jgi:hypothetical protein
MPLRTRSLQINFFRLVPVAALLMLSGAIHAQMGVAPSETGMFFNDIRIRSNQVREGMSGRAAPTGPATGTEGFYTFEESQYLGLPVDERLVGSPLGFEPVGRQVGTALGTGSAPRSYSRRMAASSSGNIGTYPSSNTFFAPTYVSDPFLSSRRNVSLGPVNIGLGLTGAVEYNDNILRASSYRAAALAADANADAEARKEAQKYSGQLDDYIGSIYLNLDVNYPISDHNRFTLTASVGVSRYFNYPDLAGNLNGFSLTVLPGTALAFDLKVGNVVFVFYDRFSVQPANRDEFSLDNTDIFGVFQNDAGIGMNWAINSGLNLSLNLNRGDTISLQDTFEQYDRTVHSLSGSLAWTPHGTWTIGLEASYALIDYREDYQNDGTTASAGVFVVLPVTRNTIVRVAGGFQTFDFDTPPLFERTVTDQDLLNTEAAITSLTDQINTINVTSTDPAAAQAAQVQLAALQSQLAAAQTTQAQQTTQKASEDAEFNSRSFDRKNSESDYYYNVVISNQLNSRVTQQLSFGHESSLNNTSNLITADYLSYGVGIIAWRGARITLSGYYESSVESGGTLKEDVDQYGFDVNLVHRLGQNLTAGIGYHFGNTDSDLELRDYVQNSFTVDLNYQLNRKWNVGLGYQYWKTKADDPSQTFTQNRIILSSGYSF